MGIPYKAEMSPFLGKRGLLQLPFLALRCFQGFWAWTHKLEKRNCCIVPPPHRGSTALSKHRDPVSRSFF